MNTPTLANRLQDLNDNPILVSLYAKSKCKHCQGRGKVTYSVPNGFGVWIERERICNCIVNAIKKEMQLYG